ncbi:uncharacterized protein LOC127803533 isoform X3 [Diospyros lotus]|uniref:uncharacterized protein LOC127803533 isoform X3 n=1 Tax=Diospyros lotus TaxID=55363 RepID=UPI002257945A|nr:uncharacterized protein LOC127803533 isoform X3 [Diospyros lotus]
MIILSPYVVGHLRLRLHLHLHLYLQLKRSLRRQVQKLVKTKEKLLRQLYMGVLEGVVHFYAYLVLNMHAQSVYTLEDHLKGKDLCLLFPSILISYRLVEEADFKSTRDLFGGRGDEKTLDNFIPKSESDFLEYAELISHKLRPYEKRFHYIQLLKDVIRLSMMSLKAADAKEVASSVTAIANEKLRAEKEANAGKKKTGGKKKQLLVDKPDDDVVVDGYDGYDDFDFM